MSTGCPCTTGPVADHADHCCFADDGHGRRTDLDEYPLGGPLPCGHQIGEAS